MKVIVGLGNYEDKYLKTRHNAGFLALDQIIPNATWKEEKKFKALIYEENNIIFVKPLTFMNKSGEAVAKLLNYYNLIPKKLGILKKKDSDLTDTLTVISDDLDIEFGKMKVCTNSGSGGQKGVQSIIDTLKTKNFRRVKIGITTELKEKCGGEKFVLNNFSQEELTQLKQLPLKEKIINDWK